MTNQDDQEENIHSATDPEKCWEMGRKYNWRVKRIEPTRDRLLKVDCVFYGKQTSFEDKRFEDASDERNVDSL